MQFRIIVSPYVTKSVLVSLRHLVLVSISCVINYSIGDHFLETTASQKRMCFTCYLYPHCFCVMKKLSLPSSTSIRSQQIIAIVLLFFLAACSELLGREISDPGCISRLSMFSVNIRLSCFCI